MEAMAAEAGTHYPGGEPPAELGSAIVRLLDDPALRDQLAEAAGRLVRERYDWRVVASRLLDVYREVA